MREWLRPEHVAAGGERCPRDTVEKFTEVDVVEYRAPEYEIERLLAKRLLHIRNAKLSIPATCLSQAPASCLSEMSRRRGHR